MRRWTHSFLLFAALLPALAQQNPPHLAYVYPAGGQRGTTFQVQAGGQFLNQVSGVLISGGGIRAEATDYARPMNFMQATQLREKAQELQKQPDDPAARKELEEIRRKLATFNRNVNPVLAETATLEITVAPDAAAGRRELRLITPQGLSNPLVFCIGELPEFTERQSELRVIPPGMTEEIGAREETSIKLPATINGRITPHPARQQTQQFTPGEADRYRFQARKGQRIVAAASARELIPYLADAVPGWFQPALAIFDSRGKELAYEDHYRFHPDPMLRYEIPADGEYAIEIRDALYRGREDFVYRVSIGELPILTATFPLGGRGGSLEKEPNDSPKNAQRVRLPAIVDGRIGRPGDRDVFAFQGRKGQEIVAEIEARRFESPLDSFLKLTDAAGKQVAFNDDHEDKALGLLTHHADSLISVTLPANGTYYLSVGDSQRAGGPDYAYRLRISPPRPDFELRVTPSGINAGRGLTVPVTVHVLRMDGFSGEVALSLKDGPRGLALSGGLVPAGQDNVRVTLTVPPTTPLGGPVSLALEGRASVQNREVVRQALPADDMMQAFAYRHLVPATGLMLAVTRGAALRTPARVLSVAPAKLTPGGSVRLAVQVLVPPNAAVGKLHFELSEPPEGVELGDADGSAIEIKCDRARAKPGLKGNLIVNILAERQVTPPNGGPPRVVRVSLGALPAVPFEIAR
jgi:hypothetical protein